VSWVIRWYFNHCPHSGTNLVLFQTYLLDSYIAASASTTSALYCSHKSTTNAMGVYTDSSPDPFDDPKVKTIVELLNRIRAIVVVSTAFITNVINFFDQLHLSSVSVWSIDRPNTYSVTNYN